MDNECKCGVCGHKWKPRKPGRPVRCGSCKSPYWDRGSIHDAVPQGNAFVESTNAKIRNNPTEEVERRVYSVPKGVKR